MRCGEFEEILVELACDRPLEESVRKQALAHTMGCESCARRLAAERALTARMLEFCRATGGLGPSPRIKEQLRAVVAERRPAQPVQTEAAPVISITSARRTRWLRGNAMSRAGAAGVAVGIAAVAILALSLMTAVWRRPSPTPDRDLALKEPAQPEQAAPAPTQSPAAPGSASASADRSDRAVAQSPAPSAGNHQRRRIARRSQAVERRADQDEAASEFVPLTPAVDEKAIENGMIVRLEVSRSKLVAMGLPLHLDGDGETVNAEVMMGDNGVAYAIRVVR